jgi:small GTP-binding protein
MSQQTKCLIVGDGAIGKTCLLSCFTNDTQNWDEEEPEYEPTTFNNFILEWTDPQGRELAVEMWDTAGQEAFEQLRKLSYPGTDIFLVGYCCVQRTSLNNIEHKWLVEIKNESSADEPWLIIVGTKEDLRQNCPDMAVSKAQAEEVCAKINACALIETSAKARTGIPELTGMMTKLAFMKLGGEKRPDWGTLQGATAAPKTGEVKKNTIAPKQDQLDAAPKELVKRESTENTPAPPAKPTQPAAKHETKPPTGGAAPSQARTQGKTDQKDGPGCSCVIA